MKKRKVEIIEKVHTSYRTASKPDKSDMDPDKTSDVITSDVRHYCMYCGRKRDESFMVKAGRAKFGKNHWRCDDDPKSCMAIRKLKKGY